jgi:hypothetical protein
MDTVSMFRYNATEGFSWEVNVIDAAIIWDLEDDPDGNVQHITEHGVTVEKSRKFSATRSLGRARAGEPAARKPSATRRPGNPSR